MYRVAVCDDEAGALEALGKTCGDCLDELGVEHLIVPFRSAEELLSALNAGEERFDMFCLDICMDGMTGMDLAHELRRRDERAGIIFITASDAYLREGYSVRAMQYLGKPVDREALMEALRSDIRLNQTPKLVTLRRGSHTVAIPIADVLYVESRDHGVYIHTSGGERFFSISLSEAEKLLPSERFCRCHNSFLVNMAAITEIGRRDLTLKDGDAIPIGRRYYEQTQLSLVRYLNANA